MAASMSTPSTHRESKVTPNPSIEAPFHGLALGPRARQCHHRSRGLDANPRRLPQFKR